MMKAMVLVGSRVWNRSGLRTQRHRSLAIMAERTMETQLKPKKPTKLLLTMAVIMGPNSSFVMNCKCSGCSP